MKYAFIVDHTQQFAVSLMCQAPAVSISGYYAWRRRAPSAHQQADAALSRRIHSAFVAGRRAYGSPRVQALLRRQGIHYGRKRVADITGIATRTGWLYLAGILDAYSRRAIGYAMDCSRDERLVEDALHMALTSRQPRAGQLHHSDRGKSVYHRHLS